ncbi:hypothetical protein KCU64_g1102, partial [Aureobasidium melanogenum]
MRLPLNQWLEHVIAQKHGALLQHTQILKTLIEDSISPMDAAKELIDDISSSRNREDTAYRLWNLLFHAAANLPSHINAIVNLTLAIYNVPPSPQAPNALSSNLWTDWQDVYSYYRTYRTLASRAALNTLTNAQRWMNFTVFSANLLAQSNNNIFVREIGIHASQHPMSRYGCPAAAPGQTPTRFVETVPGSRLSFSDDGLQMTTGNLSEFTDDVQALADHPIPAGLNKFLFDVEIVCSGRGSLVAIGLCNETSLKTEMLGREAGSWAYHGDNGKKFGGIGGGRGERYNETYDTGDIICCGVDSNSNTVTFHKNGIFLDKLHIFISGDLCI